MRATNTWFLVLTRSLRRRRRLLTRRNSCLRGDLSKKSTDNSMLLTRHLRCSYSCITTIWKKQQICLRGPDQAHLSYLSLSIFATPITDLALSGKCLMIFDAPIADLALSGPFLLPLSQILLSRAWFLFNDFCSTYHRFDSLGSIFATPITELALSGQFL